MYIFLSAISLCKLQVAWIRYIIRGPKGYRSSTRVRTGKSHERPKDAKSIRLARDGVASRPARKTGQLTSRIRITGRMCRLSRAIYLVWFSNPIRVTTERAGIIAEHVPPRTRAGAAATAGANQVCRVGSKRRQAQLDTNPAHVRSH